jgi:hypothetical protein
MPSTCKRLGWEVGAGALFWDAGVVTGAWTSWPLCLSLCGGGRSGMGGLLLLPSSHLGRRGVSGLAPGEESALVRGVAVGW